MAAPISSEYQTGFNLGYPIIYVVRMNPAGAAAPIYLTNYSGDFTIGGLPPNNRVIRYDAATLDDADFTRNLLAAEVNGSEVFGIDEIDYTFQMTDGGGLAARNECVVRLLNQGLYSNTLLGYDVDNSDIEIWQGYLPPTGSVDIDGDFVLLFKGVVYEWDGWDFNILTLRCMDNRHLVDRKIPERVIDPVTYPNAQKGLANKPFPILIGDLETGNSTTAGSGLRNDIHGITNIAPTVMVDTTTTGQKFYVSSEPWDNPSDAMYWAEGEEPWVAKIISSSVSHVDEGTGVYYIEVGGDAYADVYVRPIAPLTENTALTPGNVSDTNPDNYTDIGTAVYSLALSFNDFQEPGQFIGSSDTERRIGGAIDWVLKIDHANVVGTVTVDTIHVPSGGSFRYNSVGSLTSGAGRQVSTFNLQHVQSPAETWGAQKNYGVRIGTGLSVWAARIYNVWIEVRSFVDLSRTVLKPVPIISDIWSLWGPTGSHLKFLLRKDIVPGRAQSNIYASAKGIKYGSWIDTAPRSVGFATGAVIEQPAYAIEYILRELLGVSGSDIDTDSFDAIGNTTTGSRKDWKIAASIGSAQTATEYLRQICREFGLILYQDPNDASGRLRWRLVPIPSYSTSTEVLGITEDLIHLDESINLPSLFEVGFTPQSYVKNDIYLRYKKNYVTDSFDNEVYISSVGGDGTLTTNLSSETGALRETTYTAWLTASQTKYSVSNSASIDLEYIRDTPTAEALIKQLADWGAFRRMKISLNVIRNLDTLSLRIGDVVTVTSTLLGTNHSGFTKFIITRTNYPGMSFKSPSYITLELEEIPSVVTGDRV
jgi:hypothetical protein